MAMRLNGWQWHDGHNTSSDSKRCLVAKPLFSPCRQLLEFPFSGIKEIACSLKDLETHGLPRDMEIWKEGNEEKSLVNRTREHGRMRGT